MTISSGVQEAISILDQQGSELMQIAKDAMSSRDPRLGFERLQRWRERTVRLVAEKVHPNEGQKLQKKETFSIRTYGDPLDNLVDAVSVYTGYLGSLREELEKHPEDVLNVPAHSDEKDKTMKAPNPVCLFESMQFHPKIVEASRELYEDGHYRDAILRAFIEVNNFVKARTGLESDGRALMSQAFRMENPVIRLNELKTQSEKDEQEGFMFLFMGAMVGIRNPKAHDNVIQTDPLRTLEYLALASLLMRRAEEGVCQVK